MSPESEISLGPVKLKGKDAFGYLGWLVAVMAMGYAAYGPPQRISTWMGRVEGRLGRIEEKLGIEQPIKRYKDVEASELERKAKDVAG